MVSKEMFSWIAALSLVLAISPTQVATSSLIFRSIIPRRSRPDTSDICASGAPAAIMAAHNTSRGLVGVLHGEEASIENNPWAVYLSIDVMADGRRMSRVCTGTLINRWWVLTAGHCLDGWLPNSQILLRVGTTDSQDPERSHIFWSAETHVHWDKKQYDIALIKLEKIVSPSLATPACLNVEVPEREFAFCWTAGWGLTHWPSLTHSTRHLHQTYQKIVHETDYCETIMKSLVWKNRQVYPEVNPADNFMCTKDTNKQGGSACTGDSGGPLMCVKSGKAYLTGVTMAGDACSEMPPAQHPTTLYTRVSPQVRWIMNTILSSPPSPPS